MQEDRIPTVTYTYSPRKKDNTEEQRNRQKNQINVKPRSECQSARFLWWKRKNNTVRNKHTCNIIHQ
jgi:hypothetical protein